MPRGTLVIGVGGAGRGVVNYLKRVLEQEYGSPGNAGVVLYCIDGPIRDQYVLPGDYQIDTSHDSNEFYRLTKSSADAIKTIAQGGNFPYVEDWLNKDDAPRVPVTGIDPPAGMGGERIPGRATLFLEVNNLEPKLNQVITAARVFLPRGIDAAGDAAQGTRVNIFLIGSQSGGTGAGLLLDIAHLLQRHKGRDRLIGVIILPNSFKAVIDSPGDVTKRDAKSFIGVRELHRFLAASTELPTRITYSNNISISNLQLFDLCFLVDGQSPQLDLGTSYPIYGFVPSAADLILATIKDTQHIEPDVVNWINTYIGPATNSEKFSAYGIHTLIYPDKDLIETFAIRFAKELYKQILTPPPGTEDEGKELAFGILSSVRSFGQMAVDLEKGKGIPARPEEFGTLRLRISVGIADAPFPEDPVIDLSSVVKKSWIFRSNTNASVMQDCQDETARYLGNKSDNAPQTVYGWISYQSNQIAKHFTEQLTRSFSDVIYEVRDGQYKPRSLEQKPYTVKVANDLLRTLLDNLDGLKRSINETHKTHLQKIEGGVQTDIIILQQQRVDNVAKRLSPGDGKDKDTQQEYIEEYQKLLNLNMWNTLMEGARDLAQKLYDLTYALWIMVGDPAQGWLSFFNTCQNELEKKLASLITVRSEFGKIKVRRYFPSCNDLAEQKMFEDFVIKSGLLSDLLRDMYWTFESANPGQLGFSPRQDVESYELILHLPQLPGFDRESRRRNLADVTKGQFRDLIISSHSPEEIVHFARNRLNTPLSGMSIWDAIYYDYQNVWMPKMLERGVAATAETYVDELLNDISQKASPLLSHSVVVGENIAASGYCLSDFRDVPNYKPNSVDHLATVFHRRLQISNRANRDSSISKYIFMINYQHRVPLRNWAYYPKAMENYFKYWFEYLYTINRRDYTPVHLFPEERNASIIERYLLENHLITEDTIPMSLNIGNVPGRCLDVTVVRLLGSMEAFEAFSIAYAFNLIPVEQAQRVGDPDRYYVDIVGPTGTTRVYMGPVWNIGTSIIRFLSSDPQGENVRKVIGQKWDALYKSKQSSANWRDVLKQELQGKAGSISFPNVPIGSNDPIHRGDLKLAMQAVLCLLAEKM